MVRLGINVMGLTSAFTNALKEGCAGEPEAGPEKIRLADCTDKVCVSVPDVVTGEPVIVYIGVVEASAKPTLVTVPEPPPVEDIVIVLPDGVIVMPLPATKESAPVSPLRDSTPELPPPLDPGYDAKIVAIMECSSKLFG
jgi:hypothetical protein